MQTIKTAARALFIMVLTLALTAAVEHPARVQADSVGPQIIQNQYSNGAIQSWAYVAVDCCGEYLYTTYKDYTRGLEATYNANPAGGQAGSYMTTGPGWGAGQRIGIWTCIRNPRTGANTCNSQIVITTANCTGCNSYSRDGMIWDGKPRIPVRLGVRLDLPARTVGTAYHAALPSAPLAGFPQNPYVISTGGGQNNIIAKMVGYPSCVTAGYTDRMYAMVKEYDNGNYTMTNYWTQSGCHTEAVSWYFYGGTGRIGTWVCDANTGQCGNQIIFNV